MYPNHGYEKINDQFMLGKNILVAPVVVKGQTKKEVCIPDGTWIEQNSKQTYTGPCKISIDAPMEVLPWFKKI